MRARPIGADQAGLYSAEHMARQPPGRPKKGQELAAVFAEPDTARVATSNMPEPNLTDQLGAFQTWKQARSRLLIRLQPWLKQQGLFTTEARHAIERALRALHDEHVTVAVAGEFSRGKTELINALFFADQGRRLLPTDAGRTTMCPTEIFCDPDAPPQLRLLPIETRGEEFSLAALREDLKQWRIVELDPDDPESLAERLQMLTENRLVSKREAAELGLFQDRENSGSAHVSIPRWRLAQLNIRHPLLAQGLRILDTPGLNAIGSEPELTYEMLPAAQAVLFVLAADTGVTQSDLQIWQKFIQRPGHEERRGVMVVLNKTDTLWDELRTPGQIAESIIKQCREVSRTLGVNAQQIFATSAQKALLARVNNNLALEQRSGIASLEKHLAETMVSNRMQLIQQEHTHMVSEAIEALETIIQGRLERNGHQRQSLLDLAGQSDSAIGRMLTATQRDYEHYQTSIRAYKQDLTAFRQHGHILLTALNVRSLEKTLDDIRQTMTEAWTTYGLKDAMLRLFEDINSRIEVAARQTQSMRRLLRNMHRRFQSQHQFRLPPPPMFSIVKYQVELSLLDQEADTFRNSARTALMEQHFVTKRYFSTIVTRARRIIGTAHDDARHWHDTAQLPLATEIKEYRDDLAQQILDLRRAGDSRKTVQQRIVALKRDDSRLHVQLNSFAKVRGLLAETGIPTASRASGEN